MANIILVAGTYHGGWYWNPIISDLEAAGHSVYAPTLSGLNPDVTVAGPINLDTHINDILSIVDDNNLSEVILVGWSYGGMVITGVADRTSAKVQNLVYLDGQLPKPGQREWDLMPDRDDWVKLCLDGINFYPDAWMLGHEPRTQPHPVGTKLQPLDYDQAKFDAFAKVFIYAEKWVHIPDVKSPLERSFTLAKTMPGWQTQSWPYGHDLIREARAEVLQLLITVAKA